MTKCQRILFFVVAMIFISIIATTGFKVIAGGGECSEICDIPEEPCCCEIEEGYYLKSYSCACAGGELQWQECHYVPLP